MTTARLDIHLDEKLKLRLRKHQLDCGEEELNDFIQTKPLKYASRHQPHYGFGCFYAITLVWGSKIRGY
ncbi:hypothetical protein A9264_02790 [Vibrio sp. UCD-FRSSP16_10]|uniref:hypothetical protein n=1 Tax=unclassified Vibrio TaxID=2614977 RepID=UPI0007FCCC36|nr:MULTISPECIES: hypothetical protein [unclassified Vibrio]OBT12083.1 hypothetical protein A9260_04240 [Vibrio sp. UCD-FRSSP16_30]OBT20414.1 hypothetical protein A9264_02790 [Vibrio sp. UCD-FRSSP16_10]